MAVFQFVLVAVAAYSLWRGGRAERLVATLFVAAYLLTLGVNALAADNYMSPQWMLFGLDIVVAAALLGIARMTAQRWTVWMLALQLMAVAGHAARLFNPNVMNWVYYLLTALLGYPMLLLLAWATWTSRRTSRPAGTSLPG